MGSAFLPPGYDPATFPVGFEAPAPSGAANIIVPLAGPQGAQGPQATGSLTFTLSKTITNGTQGGGFVAPRPVVAAVTSGAFAVTLEATDDATTVETGATYSVLEQIVGAPARQFSINVPSGAQGAQARLSTLVGAQ